MDLSELQNDIKQSSPLLGGPRGKRSGRSNSDGSSSAQRSKAMILDPDGRYVPRDVDHPYRDVTDLSADNRLRQKYDVFDEVIGKGGYGTVVRGRHKSSGMSVAIKRINKKKVSKKGLSALLGEVETLAMLNHNFIVRLEDVFHDDHNLFIVMEYVPGGELGRVMRRHGGHFPESTVQRIALNLVLAIDYIHSKGIVHRDLKLANCLVSDVDYRPTAPPPALMLLSSVPSAPAQAGGPPLPSVASSAWNGSVASNRSLRSGSLHSNNGGNSTPRRQIDCGGGATSPPGSNGDSMGHGGSGEQSATRSPIASPPRGDPIINVKIADFGFGVMVGNEHCLTTFCGTTSYMAPEVLSRREVRYGKPVDLWSLGVMIYVLLCGDHPFHGASSKLTDNICNGDFNFSAPQWGNVSDLGKDFVSRLLVVDPSRRMTAGEALSHPWIRSASDLNDEDTRQREELRRLDDERNNDDEDGAATEYGSFTTEALGDGDSLLSTSSLAQPPRISSNLFATARQPSAASGGGAPGGIGANSHLLRNSAMASPRTLQKLRRAKLRRRFKIVVNCVLAMNRLIFLQKLTLLKREGADLALLRSFSYLVGRRFEPASKSMTACNLCHQNPKALSMVTDMLESSQTVETFDVSSNGIDNVDAVQRIVKVTARHPSLTALNLEDNPIPPLAGRALLRLSRSALRLRLLNVENTLIGNDTISQISQNVKDNEWKRKVENALNPSASSSAASSPVPAAQQPHTGNPKNLRGQSRTPVHHHHSPHHSSDHSPARTQRPSYPLSPQPQHASSSMGSPSGARSVAPKTVLFPVDNSGMASSSTTVGGSSSTTMLVLPTGGSSSSPIGNLRHPTGGGAGGSTSSAMVNNQRHRSTGASGASSPLNNGGGGSSSSLPPIGNSSSGASSPIQGASSSAFATSMARRGVAVPPQAKQPQQQQHPQSREGGA